MRRVLVPLDGTDSSTAILDDAVRLAGPDGTLILVQEVKRITGRAAGVYDPVLDTELARQHLAGVAAGLRARGISVTTHTHTTYHVAGAIAEAAREHEADMIACTTHSHGTLGSFLWGSVAWKVLVHSPVPVVLRHPNTGEGARPMPPQHRRVLVPLDRSQLAEKALPLALKLAAEWNAPIDLVVVVPFVREDADAPPVQDYLAHLRESLAGQVQTHVLTGDPVQELIAFVHGADVTDIVMTTHGRTGLSRVLVGSVAYEMIRRSALPVIVVPALAEARQENDDHIEAREALTPVGSNT
jgi:nucleotide-binding universal stress UspA family protein